MSKKNERTARAQQKAAERLIALTNALKRAILDQDSSVLDNIQRNTNLSSECVKHSLDEVFSVNSSTRLADVILDEGHLFDRDSRFSTCGSNMSNIYFCDS